jgi:spermidine/putrescine-binding protein
VYAVIRRKYFLKLDWRKIPNAKRFHASALDNWVAGEDWGLTWPDALHTGVYRADLPSPPREWSETLDRDPGYYRASYMSLYTFAAAYAPGRAAQAIQEDFDGVYAFAREKCRAVRLWWATSPDMAFNLSQGNVSAGNIHSVDALQMIQEKRPVDLFTTADRAHFQAIWLVPKGTRYPELAHEFLNQFASLELQREYTAAGLPTPIPELARERAAADPLWARVNPHTDEDFSRLHYYPYDAYTKNWEAMTDRWNQEILV